MWRARAAPRPSGDIRMTVSRASFLRRQYSPCRPTRVPVSASTSRPISPRFIFCFVSGGPHRSEPSPARTARADPPRRRVVARHCRIREPRAVSGCCPRSGVYLARTSESTRGKCRETRRHPSRDADRRRHDRRGRAEHQTARLSALAVQGDVQRRGPDKPRKSSGLTSRWTRTGRTSGRRRRVSVLARFHMGGANPMLPISLTGASRDCHQRRAPRGADHPDVDLSANVRGTATFLKNLRRRIHGEHDAERHVLCHPDDGSVLLTPGRAGRDSAALSLDVRSRLVNFDNPPGNADPKTYSQMPRSCIAKSCAPPLTDPDALLEVGIFFPGPTDPLAANRSRGGDAASRSARWRSVAA